MRHVVGRRLLLSGLVLVAALAVLGGATASPTSAGVDQRTRSIADLLETCGRSTTLALRAADGAGAATAGAAVRRGKTVCEAGERRIRALSTDDGLDLVVENALVPLDNWARALDRISRYIRADKPADRARGKTLLASGYTWSALVLRELNDIRLRNRLAKL